MPARTYFIRGWDEHFETAQSRRCKDLKWVGVPNQHDGKSFRRLMRMPRGLALFGAWMLIVQVASKCPQRGILRDADGPLTAEDIAVKTDSRVEDMTEAMSVLTSETIAWMGILEEPHSEGSATRGAAEELYGEEVPSDSRRGQPADSEHARSQIGVKSERQQPTDRQNKQRRQTEQAAAIDVSIPGQAGKRSEWQNPTTRQLQSATSVLLWLVENAASLNLDATDHLTQVRILASAAKALRGQRPPRLFGKLMLNGLAGDWSWLTDDDLAGAKAALRAENAAFAKPEALALSKHLGGN